jgi:hypothetical protein
MFSKIRTSKPPPTTTSKVSKPLGRYQDGLVHANLIELHAGISQGKNVRADLHDKLLRDRDEDAVSGPAGEDEQGHYLLPGHLRRNGAALHHHAQPLGLSLQRLGAGGGPGHQDCLHPQQLRQHLLLPHRQPTMYLPPHADDFIKLRGLSSEIDIAYKSLVLCTVEMICSFAAI